MYHWVISHCCTHSCTRLTLASTLFCASIPCSSVALVVWKNSWCQAAGVPTCDNNHSVTINVFSDYLIREAGFFHHWYRRPSLPLNPS